MKDTDSPAVVRRRRAYGPFNQLPLFIASVSIAALLCSAGAKFATAQPQDQGVRGKVHQHNSCHVRLSVRGLRIAAALGNAHAMNSLGCLYEHGQRVPNDPTRALAWYRKAADLGFVPAMYRLGEIAIIGSRCTGKHWPTFEGAMCVDCAKQTRRPPY